MREGDCLKDTGLPAWSAERLGQDIGHDSRERRQRVREYKELKGS
jgi:hypothetical protein